MTICRLALVVLLALLLCGCSTVEWLGVRLLYQKAAPAERVLRDVAYQDGPQSDAVKHRLDFFLPQGEGWPSAGPGSQPDGAHPEPRRQGARAGDLEIRASVSVQIAHRRWKTTSKTSLPLAV